MEEMGMTDLQFKSHLKSVVADLESARRKAEQEAAAETLKELDEMIRRFKSDIES